MVPPFSFFPRCLAAAETNAGPGRVEGKAFCMTTSCSTQQNGTPRRDGGCHDGRGAGRRRMVPKRPWWRWHADSLRSEHARDVQGPERAPTTSCRPSRPAGRRWWPASPTSPSGPATGWSHRPDVRGHRRVPPGRRGHRRRPQGDVRLRGQGRPAPRPAARGHRLGGAGLRAAPPDAAVEGLVRRRRTSATSGRRPAATASTTSSASRSLGSDDPDLDVEVIALRRRLLRARSA